MSRFSSRRANFSATYEAYQKWYCTFKKSLLTLQINTPQLNWSSCFKWWAVKANQSFSVTKLRKICYGFNTYFKRIPYLIKVKNFPVYLSSFWRESYRINSFSTGFKIAIIQCWFSILIGANTISHDNHFFRTLKNNIYNKLLTFS